ncbi:unnamed protein product [Pleuronectes platessa]|uniref:Uncharacterized protein n=1 Tax=Pleuronectes platessa TaxID=8262 RepID=A0A9N7UUZ7_PLEPL|nr:unnamed protein product [Pleuronectes platessa]
MLVCGAGPGCNNAGVARAICQVRHGGLEPLVLALGEGRREGMCPKEASTNRSTSVAPKNHGKNVGCCYFSDNTAGLLMCDLCTVDVIHYLALHVDWSTMTPPLQGCLDNRCAQDSPP